MKRILAVMFSALLAFTMISGCATMRLAGDAGVAEQVAAKAQDCANAQAGYLLAEQMLNDPGMNADATKYWNNYKVGARLVILAVCSPSGLSAAK